MAQQFRQRPSSLSGVDDPYAAYCFDEAIYLWGNFVESELRRVSAGAKTDKEAQRKRKDMLAVLLRDDEEPMIIKPGQKTRSVHRNHNVATLDKDDPVSPETAARMPRATKFTGRKFKDPAELFTKKT